MDSTFSTLQRRFFRGLREPRAVLEYLGNRLSSACPGLKDPAVRRMARWGYGNAPRVTIDEVFSGIQSVVAKVSEPFDYHPDVSVTPEEMFYLCAIVSHLRPRRLLEIGTFEGNTTLNLALNSPADAIVTTVDMPPEWQGQLLLEASPHLVNVTDRTRIGRRYRGTELERKIRQVLGDSACLNWDGLLSPFDFAFIDGCHSYNYVMSDTRGVLQHLETAGVIVWHDYGFIRDVSRAVDCFSQDMEIKVICGTRLAVGVRRR